MTRSCSTQQLEAIHRLQREGFVVAMLSDGISDAPALAAADIALVVDDLLNVPEAIALSKRTLRTIRQNVAITRVAVGALLAGVLAGDVRMGGGMLVHEASVLVVILNSMRLLRAPAGSMRVAPAAPSGDVAARGAAATP